VTRHGSNETPVERGDDGEDDLYMDEHPDVTVLLLVTAPDSARPHEPDLSVIEGVIRLRSTRR
jgi:hypothetical protein